MVHVCEQKRRHLQRDEKPVMLAFMAYQQFFKRQMIGKSIPEYRDFAKSHFYLEFVRFGRYTVDINAINPLGFVDFLLRVEMPLKKWFDPRIYQTYIRELSKKETPVDAMERTFKLMRRWADDSGNNWWDFFRLIEPPLAALYISNGRVSPWVLLNAESAHDLMQRFTEEQIELIEKTIDPDFWRLKIERHHHDVKDVREILAENRI